MITISQHNIQIFRLVCILFTCIPRTALRFLRLRGLGLRPLAFVAILLTSLSCSDNSEQKTGEIDNFNKSEPNKQVVHYGQKMSLLGSYSESQLRRLLDMEKRGEHLLKAYGRCNKIEIQINSETRLKFGVEWFKSGCNMGVGRDNFYLEGYEIFDFEYKNSELAKAMHLSRNLKMTTSVKTYEIQLSGNLDFLTEENLNTVNSNFSRKQELILRPFRYRQSIFVTPETEVMTSDVQTEISLISDSQGYYELITDGLRLTKLNGQVEYERYKRNSSNRKQYIAHHSLNLKNHELESLKKLGRNYSSESQNSDLRLNHCGILNGQLEYELQYNQKTIQTDFSNHNNEVVFYQKGNHSYDQMACNNKEPFFYSSLARSLNRLLSFQSGIVK